jgi:hypothetical protein
MIANILAAHFFPFSPSSTNRRMVSGPKGAQGVKQESKPIHFASAQRTYAIPLRLRHAPSLKLVAGELLEGVEQFLALLHIRHGRLGVPIGELGDVIGNPSSLCFVNPDAILS